MHTQQQYHYHHAHTAAVPLPPCTHSSSTTTTMHTQQQYHHAHTAAVPLPPCTHSSSITRKTPRLMISIYWCRRTHTRKAESVIVLLPLYVFQASEPSIWWWNWFMETGQIITITGQIHWHLMLTTRGAILLLAHTQLPWSNKITLNTNNSQHIWLICWSHPRPPHSIIHICWCCYYLNKYWKLKVNTVTKG